MSDELGSIVRELHIDASPERVYEVVTSPEHMRDWWPVDASFDAVPGATGTLTFGTAVERITVLEADPPRRFSFRWVEDGSLLVTFDLTPYDEGTLLRMTETGYRERGWEAAVLEQTYHDHVRGWDAVLPRLQAHAARLP